MKTLPLDEYVDYPTLLGLKFDFVIVDGRKRRRCIEVSKKIVSEDGVIILHDAQRPYYWPACQDLKVEMYYDRKGTGLFFMYTG